MMRIRLLLVSMALAICCKSYVVAQVEYKTTNYTHDLSQVKVSVSFLNIENILTPITTGVMVEGQLRDKIFYQVQFRQGYLRNIFISPASLITSQKESKGTVFETGIDWPFIDKIRPGRVKVKTSSGFDGTYTYEKSFMAKCEGVNFGR